MKDIDHRQIRHFLAVLDHRQFTAAAAKCHITQPALTKSIKQLEQQLGVKLLERSPSGVEPTRFGQILATRAKLSQIELLHAISEIEALKEGQAGTIKVGVGPSFIDLLANPILRLQQERPKVRFRVIVAIMDTLLASLLAGDLDVICTALEFPSYPDIAKEPLLETDNPILVRENHPLAGKQVVQPGEVLAYSWIGFSKDYMSVSRLGAYFAARHLPPPDITVEVSSVTALFAILNKSDYVASVPSLLLPRARSLKLVKLPIVGPIWPVSLGIAYRKTEHPLPILDAFVDILREVLVAEKKNLD